MPSDVLPWTASDGHALFFWPHAAAAHAIPSGYTRDDDYAGKFFQGNASGGTNGGSSTHSHTQSHTHTGDAHNHGSVSLGAGYGTSGAAVSFSPFGVRRARKGSSSDTHTHAAVASTSATATYDADTTAVTAGGAEPEYNEVIAVRPDDATRLIPQFGVTLSADEIAPYSDFCDGTASTVDLTGKFLKGAAAASDPGAAGGSSTHNHGGTLNHSHTSPAHSHPDFQCGDSSNDFRCLAGVASTSYLKATHDISSGADGAGTTSSENATVAAASNEPAHTVLIAQQHNNATPMLMPGMIVAFTGDATELANWPDWKECDGTGGTPDLSDQQIKIATLQDLVDGNLLSAAGANSHNHQIEAHGHTHTGSHTHTGFESNHDYPATIASGAGNLALGGVKHAVADAHAFTFSAVTPTLQNAAAFASGAADGRMPYRTVMWIMFLPETTTALLKGGLLKGGLLK